MWTLGGTESTAHPGLPAAASVLEKLLDCQGGFFSFGVFQLPREETQHLSPAGLPRARAAGVGGRRQVSGPQSDAVLLSAASSLSLTLQTLNQAFMVHKTLTVSESFHGVPNQKMQ